MGKNYLKQFTEWAIGSRDNIFLRARLKLTFLYMAFIALILAVFSVGLYVNISKNVRDNIDDKIKEHTARQEAILLTEQQLKEEFIIGDIVILLVSGGLAFLLAAKNLLPIQKAMEKQTRFTADASHDLRTPLAIMKTDCEVTLKKNDASLEEFRELAKSNLEEVNRMAVMAEQLLFLSRNNEGLAQQMKKIPLGRLAEKMVKSFQSLAKNKNIKLTFSGFADDAVRGNLLDLERVFFNLLKNAIDYTPNSGNIVVVVIKECGQIKLSIKDDGIGIASEDLPHITEAFYRGDKVRSQENGGSGLGLSIVAEITKRHNGKLRISSEKNRGTEVVIIFPSCA